MKGVKDLQINQVSALNNPLGVDIPWNKKTKPKVKSYDYNQTFKKNQISALNNPKRLICRKTIIHAHLSGMVCKMGNK